MKKLLTLLILSLLVLTSCSQNKVLSEQEIETALVNMSEDEKFFKNIDATINFSVKGEAKPSPFIPQEAKPANALQKIDSQFTFNFQFMEEPQQEMFMSGEIRGQGLNNEEIREEFYSYGHQVGDQMKIYTSEGEGWQEQEMVDTFKPQSFDFKGSKEIAENFVEAMTKHSDNFSIAEKVVMVGSTPTTEIILPINQNLMVHPNSSAHLEKIKAIKSHPQALAQTQQFLDERFNLATQEVTASTTEAAKWLHDHPNELVAAVASLEAAKMYGLDIIYPNIQDVENNQTRFWIIGHENITKKETSIFNKRRSIGVSFTENKPGNLHKVLSVFSWREIDLTKIESRPLRTQLGEYFFLIDIQNESPSLVEMAILELEELGGVIKELGTYPVYLEKAF